MILDRYFIKIFFMPLNLIEKINMKIFLEMENLLKNQRTCSKIQFFFAKQRVQEMNEELERNKLDDEPIEAHDG